MIYYQVIIKEEKPKIITEGQYQTVKRQLFKKARWIEISNELFDTYLLGKITKILWYEDYIELTKNENKNIKEKLKKAIFSYNKEINKKILINMLEIIKS